MYLQPCLKRRTWDQLSLSIVDIWSVQNRNYFSPLMHDKRKNHVLKFIIINPEKLWKIIVFKFYMLEVRWSINCDKLESKKHLIRVLLCTSTKALRTVILKRFKKKIRLQTLTTIGYAKYLKNYEFQRETHFEFHQLEQLYFCSSSSSKEIQMK